MGCVILVDEEDNPVGTMEKMEAHERGLLHRAFSILLFNSKGELLLQKRSEKKYHSGGLWTNTCCSHPLPDEAMAQSARQKLKQEMGIDVQPVFIYKFRYQTEVDRNLIEHEFDYVFIGSFDGEPVINKEEVEDWKFIDLHSLRKDMEQNPSVYTPWFKLIVNHHQLERNLFRS
jgi:isopentenyl-diphosphate delta-isomerase